MKREAASASSLRLVRYTESIYTVNTSQWFLTCNSSWPIQLRHTGVWTCSLHRAPPGSPTKHWWAQTALHQVRHMFCCRGKRDGPCLLRDNLSEPCLPYSHCCSHPGKQHEIELCFCPQFESAGMSFPLAKVSGHNLGYKVADRFNFKAGGPWPNGWDMQGKGLGLDSRTWGPYSPPTESHADVFLLALCINISFRIYI